MRLYALCDWQLLQKKRISLEEFVAIAVANKAEILQYRDKTSDIAFIKQQLITIRKIYEGFLLVNDKYELVEFCDGVHVGQEDLLEIDADKAKAVKILRQVVGSDKILGLSTHNLQEVVEANDFDLNYIGLGPFRNTSTKSDLQDVLGEKLDTIASHAKHYVAAIGGVRKEDRFRHVTYHVMGSGLLV